MHFGEGDKGEFCRVRRATFWEFWGQSHIIIVPVCYWGSWKPLPSAHLPPSCSEGGGWWWECGAGTQPRYTDATCLIALGQTCCASPYCGPEPGPESQPRRLPFPSALVGLAFSSLLSTTFLPFCPVHITHCPVGVRPPDLAVIPGSFLIETERHRGFTFLCLWSVQITIPKWKWIWH